MLTWLLIIKMLVWYNKTLLIHCTHLQAVLLIFLLSLLYSTIVIMYKSLDILVHNVNYKSKLSRFNRLSKG